MFLSPSCASRLFVSDRRSRQIRTWALAVREAFAREHSLTTLGDPARHVNEGGIIKPAACEEFVTREDALPAFKKAYGFSLPGMK